MKLTTELTQQGCVLKIDKNPKKGRIYFSAQIIHPSKTFRITQRTGVISLYFVDHKGFDAEYQVFNYILKTIKGESKC